MLDVMGQCQVFLCQLDFTFWRWDGNIPEKLGNTVAANALTLCIGMALDKLKKKNWKKNDPLSSIWKDFA